MASPHFLERHKRHLLLKEVGGPGLARLGAARIAIIGAGALGGPCALYLAAAGVGTIEIHDDDHVELSNLQRQVQFSQADIGKPKAACLAQKLAALNDDVTALAVAARFGAGSGVTADILVDATDSFESRFDVNAAAIGARVPLVSGAASGWQGQVAVFTPGRPGGGPCYRCLVGEVPAGRADCETLGVVGAVTGIVGARLALEALKLVTGAGPSQIGRFWRHDALTGEGKTVKIAPDPECPACG